MSENKKAACEYAAQHGFTVLEDVEPSDFRVEDLEFVYLRRRGDPHPMDGDAIRLRAIELDANYGLADAWRVNCERDKLPPGLEDYAVVFTGARLRHNESGKICMPVMMCNDAGWVLIFFTTDFNSGSGCMLPRKKRPPR